PVHPATMPLLPSILAPGIAILSQIHLTTLWAGYGSIHRLSLRLPSSPHSSPPSSIILKVITPPQHSSADIPDEGHLRKLISYAAESWFYNNLSQRLNRVYAEVGGRGPKVAEAYQDLVRSGNPAMAAMGGMILALEDLKIKFPYNVGYVDSLSHAQAVIRWLARFHAGFMHCGEDEVPGLPPPMLAKSDDSGAYTGVWRQGSYWYLATRRSEYEDMVSSGEWGWLEPWVEYVDKKLWPESPSGDDVEPASHLGRTILHGDTKAANILFTKPITGNNHSYSVSRAGGSESDVEAALYDFQYVGHGLGAVDLVYFLATSVGLYRTEMVYWQRYYYDEVVAAVEELGLEGGVRGWTWDVFRRQFNWAVVDWCRFGAGWGGWGNW
ncbi:hypothetical protein L211DRAFT_764789, partial [Terfezia boudieri ATCC MYA-4762]